MSDNEVDSPEKQKDKLMTKLYWHMLQIAFIFAIPAAIALVVGTKVDSDNSSKTWTFIFLLTAFMFSWGMIVYLYRKLSREAKEVDDLLRVAKKSKAKSLDQLEELEKVEKE